MRVYSITKPLEPNSNLAILFNQALKAIEIERLFTAPSCTSSDWYEKDQIHKDTIATGFYEICMIEVCLNSIIDHLERWKEEAITYNTVYNSSWKYYAHSERLKSIEEFGGEEEDYNENGKVIKKVSEDKLQSYSIVESWRGYNDIIFKINPTKMNYLGRALGRVSEFSVSKVFSDFFDKEVTTYREDDTGNMIKNTWAEQLLSEVKDQHVADSLKKVVYHVLFDVKDLVEDIQDLKADSNNKAFFKALPNRIDNLLNLQLCPSK